MRDEGRAVGETSQRIAEKRFKKNKTPQILFRIALGKNCSSLPIIGSVIMIDPWLTKRFTRWRPLYGRESSICRPFPICSTDSTILMIKSKLQLKVPLARTNRSYWAKLKAFLRLCSRMTKKPETDVKILTGCEYEADPVDSYTAESPLSWASVQRDCQKI